MWDDIAFWIFSVPLVFGVVIRSDRSLKAREYRRAFFHFALALYVARVCIVRMATAGAVFGVYERNSRVWQPVAAVLGSDEAFFIANGLLAVATVLLVAWDGIGDYFKIITRLVHIKRQHRVTVYSQELHQHHHHSHRERD